MKKLMMLSAAILTLQAIPALAQDKPMEGERRGGGPGHFFDKHDLDKDGVITEAEFLSVAKERFGHMDADKDGKLTKEEVAAGREKMKQKFKEEHGDKLKGKAGEIVKPAPDVAPPVTE